MPQELRRRRDGAATTLAAVARRMHDDEVEVNETLVRRLLAAQMPHLADRPISIVEPWGTDNGIWRLGDDLVVRLPRIGWAAGQVGRDATWLPRLAPHLPVAVPEPVAVGEPADGYPYQWAVHRWIPGDGAALDRIDDPITFALEVAAFVQQLQHLPTDGAPAARNRAWPTAADVTLAELQLEAFLPADEATAQVLRRRWG